MNSKLLESMRTPSLVVDYDVLKRNISISHNFFVDSSIRIRPHVKTHKSLEIAQLQLDAGAKGLTVATVGEAEVFSKVCNDIFIAYPLWPDENQFKTLNSLSRNANIIVGVDSIFGIKHLSTKLDRSIQIMIEVDSGHGRTGCAPARAGEVAEATIDHGFDLRGIFTFPGHSYGRDKACSAADDEADALSVAKKSVWASIGKGDLELSGGSTPSFISSKLDVITETRPGVYVFNDAQQWELGHVQPDDISLTAYARVVSQRPGYIVLDSGSKVLGADRAPYATGYGRLIDLPDAQVVQLSEHHAVVETDATLHLGSIVRVVPNHACTAVNLVDELIPVSGNQIFSPWRVEARGLNR
ncbi:D-TA family PLP-dependent enzyme [Brevibacterium paucivorans]